MIRRALHALWALAVVGVLALNVAFPLPGQEASWPWATGLMAFPVAAALILARRPRNPVGRVLGVVGVCAAVIFVGTWASLEYARQPWSPYVEALLTAAVVAQFWGVVALLYLFPTGLPPVRSGRWAFAAFTAWMVLMIVVVVFRQGPLDVTGRPNPLGVGPVGLSSLFDIGLWGLPVGVLCGVATLIVRRRRATAAERAQLKWFISASGLVVVVVAMIAFVPEEGAPPIVDVVGGVIVVAGFWALPAAIVAAVLRYRLYDIDRLVSRSVSYGVVIALLGAVYTGGVFALPALLPMDGSVVVAASTLAVAALFNPLRRAVLQAVERRFDRPRFDREQEVARFARRLRGQVDLDDVLTSLTAATRTTMHPTAVSVWIRTGS